MNLADRIIKYNEENRLLKGWKLELNPDGTPGIFLNRGYEYVFSVVKTLEMKGKKAAIETHITRTMKALGPLDDNTCKALLKAVDTERNLAEHYEIVARIDDIDSIPVPGNVKQKDLFIYMERLEPLIRVILLKPDGYKMEYCSEQLKNVNLGFMYDLIRNLFRMESELKEAFHHVTLENLFYKPEFHDLYGAFKLSGFATDAVMIERGMSRIRRETDMYMAPEIYRGGPYDERAEVYSVGVLLYLLFNDMEWPGTNTPYWERNEKDLRKRYTLKTMPLPKNGILPLSDKNKNDIKWYTDALDIDLTEYHPENFLRHIIAHACENDPDKRYKSFDDFYNPMNFMFEQLFPS